MRSASTVLVCLALIATAAIGQEEQGAPSGAANNKMAQVDAGDRPVPIIPTPQEVSWGKGEFSFGEVGACRCEIALKNGAEQAPLLSSEFTKRLAKRFSVAPTEEKGGVQVIFSLGAEGLPKAQEITADLKSIASEGYVIATNDTRGGPQILIAGNSIQALWHGMVTAADLVTRPNGQLLFPRIRIVDYPRFKDRSLFLEVGGQGFMVGPSRWRFDQWKDFVDWMVDHKFNDLWLEFIGSGRLMGNLDMDKGQWIGYPMTLQNYPQLVGKDRPIQRWDEAQGKVVEDSYTIPNVAHDFIRELIDYAQARGVRCDLTIGWDYFANQMPVVLKLPSNDPENAEANKVYDDLLKETVERYSNASGVVLVTIENKNVPPTMLDAIIRRANEAETMIKAINPKMEVALLPDYLEWRPLHEIEILKAGLPADMALAYTPHREPQQKEWERIYPNAWRYQLYTQYAWDHIVYALPEQIQREALLSYADGYRRMVSQAFYFDAFAINFMAMAEYSWNPTSGPVEGFWDKALDEQYGRKARNLMRTALEHTRFDVRFDIIARMIMRPNIEGRFSFWDMYHLTTVDHLSDALLASLEDDARQSRTAALTALPLVPDSAKEAVTVTIVSAERRLYLATSARHLLKVLAFKKAGKVDAAKAEMKLCLEDGAKMEAAASKLGIEYPMAVHDLKVVERYREVAAGL